jgi:hypothetical protein
LRLRTTFRKPAAISGKIVPEIRHEKKRSCRAGNGVSDRRASIRTHGDLNYWWSIGITENRIPLFGAML